MLATGDVGVRSTVHGRDGRGHFRSWPGGAALRLLMGDVEGDLLSRRIVEEHAGRAHQTDGLLEKRNRCFMSGGVQWG